MCFKNDKILIERFLNASQAGRKVDLSAILNHELHFHYHLLININQINESMNSTTKSRYYAIIDKITKINLLIF